MGMGMGMNNNMSMSTGMPAKIDEGNEPAHDRVLPA
jgi:hypothetical protein